MTNSRGFPGALAAIAALALWAVPAALPSGGDHGGGGGGGTRVTGTCTKSSTAKLKLSREDGRIEVQFEVDQNRIGRTWSVVVRQNGAVVRRLTKVTRAPSGSFEARVLARNASGTDRFTVSASRPGERCRASASF